MIYTIVFLLTLHYVADFLCQTREMATKKGSSILWLSIHVLTYTFCFGGVFGFYLLWSESMSDKSVMEINTFIILNGILHWVTDFLTSKLTSYFYKKENMYGFFSIVGLDQLIHATTILLTYNYLFIK